MIYEILAKKSCHSTKCSHVGLASVITLVEVMVSIRRLSE